MSMRIAGLLSAFLFVTVLVHGASEKSEIKIKVLKSETQALPVDDNGVPINCDQVTFDAYCRSSRFTRLKTTLLVQEGDNPPVRVACTMESKLSRCVPLPVGESFEAKKEKHGLAIYYADDTGKVRKQSFTFVALDAQPANLPVQAAVVAPPTAARSSSTAIKTAAPIAAAAAPAAAPQLSTGSSDEKVRCNFASTPVGAEITLDGKYVGSTPSEISVGTGTHVVSFFMSGYAPWKRDLTVMRGSELSVSAILQKETQ